MGSGDGSLAQGSGEVLRDERERMIMNGTYGRSEWLLRAALREDRGGRPKVAQALRQMAEDARPLATNAPAAEEVPQDPFSE